MMPISDAHHVARYCKPSMIDEGMPLAGVFLPRPTERHLSINWLEFFGTAKARDDQIHDVRHALQAKGYRISPNGRLAVLNVGDVKRVAIELNTTLRVRRIPRPNDPSHAGILGYSAGDLPVALALQSLVREEDVFRTVA